MQQHPYIQLPTRCTLPATLAAATTVQCINERQSPRSERIMMNHVLHLSLHSATGGPLCLFITWWNVDSAISLKQFESKGEMAVEKSAYLSRCIGTKWLVMQC